MRKDLQYRFNMFLGTKPALFYPYWRLTHPHHRGIVYSGTRIVIEAFPRSANTFADCAFRLSQPEPVPFAHHIHLPVQIMSGVRRRLPVLLIVRDPLEAMASLGVFHPSLSLKTIVDYYLYFHSAVMPYLSEIVVATFEQVTNDFGRVMERVNSRYGVSFGVFEHSPENQQRVLEILAEDASKKYPDDAESRMTGIVSPKIRQKRDSEKSEIKTALLGRFQPEISKSEALYAQFRGLAAEDSATA